MVRVAPGQIADGRLAGAILARRPAPGTIRQQAAVETVFVTETP